MNLHHADHHQCVVAYPEATGSHTCSGNTSVMNHTEKLLNTVALNMPRAEAQHAFTSRSPTKGIPIKGSSIKRSNSETQMMESKKLAEHRDYHMYKRIVNGPVRLQNSNPNNASWVSHEDLDNIMWTQYTPVTMLDGFCGNANQHFERLPMNLCSADCHRCVVAYPEAIGNDTCSNRNMIQNMARAEAQHAFISRGPSKAIPIKASSIKRTNSEIQLIEGKKLAELRDYRMYKRIVNGTVRHQNSNSYDASWTSHVFLDNIMRTRSTPVTILDGFEDTIDHGNANPGDLLQHTCSYQDRRNSSPQDRQEDMEIFKLDM